MGGKLQMRECNYSAQGLSKHRTHLSVFNLKMFYKTDVTVSNPIGFMGHSPTVYNIYFSTMIPNEYTQWNYKGNYINIQGVESCTN